jgi:predicted enzyme related to lactoylglutathione lyase
MTDPKQPPFGAVAWRDLTVEDAETLRDFYAAVAGWTPNAVNMGDYEDFDMRDTAGNSVAGICHARGSNAKLPPQWLIYILVEDVMAAAAACTSLGGEVVDGPRDMGGGRFCVIRDPGGAHTALYQPQGAP